VRLTRLLEHSQSKCGDGSDRGTMTLFTPDNFKRNWYGWVTNQWAHVMLGQLLFGLAMIASFYAVGEFGNRVNVWLYVAAAYAFWEVITFIPGKFWDAVEDFCFVVVYGAGWLASCFHEVNLGQSGFFGDIFAVLPVIGLFAFHTTLGVFFRLVRRAN